MIDLMLMIDVVKWNPPDRTFERMRQKHLHCLHYKLGSQVDKGGKMEQKTNYR